MDELIKYLNQCRIDYIHITNLDKNTVLLNRITSVSYVKHCIRLFLKNNTSIPEKELEKKTISFFESIKETKEGFVIKK